MRLKAALCAFLVVLAGTARAQEASAPPVLSTLRSVERIVAAAIQIGDAEALKGQDRVLTRLIGRTTVDRDKPACYLAIGSLMNVIADSGPPATAGKVVASPRNRQSYREQIVECEREHDLVQAPAVPNLR